MTPKLVWVSISPWLPSCGWHCPLSATDGVHSCRHSAPAKQTDAYAELAWACFPHTQVSATVVRNLPDHLSAHSVPDWPLEPSSTVLPQHNHGQIPLPSTDPPKPSGLPQPSLGPWLMTISSFFSSPWKRYLLSTFSEPCPMPSSEGPTVNQTATAITLMELSV